MALNIVNDAPDSETVSTDVEAIGQILFNLVDNACKYARDTDDRSIDVRARLAGEHLEFTVSDHGPGIRPEHARIIFAPFERGAHGPGDTIPGVGLGLALCRGLARDLGGDLTLEKPNCGACFKLTVARGA
jgi:signal transduction histidine kinase